MQLETAYTARMARSASRLLWFFDYRECGCKGIICGQDRLSRPVTLKMYDCVA